MPGDRGPGDEQLGLLGLLGTLVPIDEAAMDAATAVMSCSPAYIALVAERSPGLERTPACPLRSPTSSSPTRLPALRSSCDDATRGDPARRRVAGGATEAGLEALAERDLEAAVHEAVRASLERMRL